MKCPVYSGTPLLWTPWGPGEVSCIERGVLISVVDLTLSQPHFVPIIKYVSLY